MIPDEVLTLLQRAQRADLADRIEVLLKKYGFPPPDRNGSSYAAIDRIYACLEGLSRDLELSKSALCCSILEPSTEENIGLDRMLFGSAFVYACTCGKTYRLSADRVFRDGK